MASCLTDFEEARKKPVRTLAGTMASVFVSLALVDYFLAGTRSYASAAGVGGTCAVVTALVVSRGMWPGIFDRSIALRPRSRVAERVWRWAYPVVCLTIA